VSTLARHITLPGPLAAAHAHWGQALVVGNEHCDCFAWDNFQTETAGYSADLIDFIREGCLDA
jgi:hypothetical protein